MCVDSSGSESLSDSAACFPAAVDRLGPRAPIGRLFMTAAKRLKRFVKEVEGSVAYLGGAKAARFARRCTFSSTPRAEYSGGDNTEASVRGRLAENCFKEARGNRLGRRGSVKMCWKSEVYASKSESECEDPKVLRGWVRRGTRSGIDGDPFSSTGYMRINQEFVRKR
jgi:hypothetical protein